MAFKKNPADKANTDQPAKTNDVSVADDQPATNVGIETPEERVAPDQTAGDDGATRATPAPADPNYPTQTGFTAQDPGVTAPQETPGLRRLTMDEVTRLRDALNQLVGYQTGSMYRNDFVSGLETIRPFGFTYDVQGTDDAATITQEDALHRETASPDINEG